MSNRGGGTYGRGGMGLLVNVEEASAGCTNPAALATYISEVGFASTIRGVMIGGAVGSLVGVGVTLAAIFYLKKGA